MFHKKQDSQAQSSIKTSQPATGSSGTDFANNHETNNHNKTNQNDKQHQHNEDGVMNAQSNAQVKETQAADNAQEAGQPGQNAQDQAQGGQFQQGAARNIPGPARAPGVAYPGAYPGSTPSASNFAPQGQANDAVDGRKLVVGRGITMSGEIESCDHLVVEGTMEAALKGASVLDIEESGVFYGAVEINEATVAGRFEGDLTVNGRLTVTDTGSITGSVAYKELAVEAGAVIDGKITPLEQQQRSQGSQPRGDGKSGKVRSPASNQDLPFSDKAATAANAAE